MSFVGRHDLFRGGRCGDCGGRKVDRRNRKRLCRVCNGDGLAWYCGSCGEPMPCRGTDANEPAAYGCKQAKFREWIDKDRTGLYVDCLESPRRIVFPTFENVTPTLPLTEIARTKKLL